MKTVYLPHLPLQALMKYGFCSVTYDPEDSRFTTESIETRVVETVIGITDCDTKVEMNLIAKQPHGEPGKVILIYSTRY